MAFPNAARSYPTSYPETGCAKGRQRSTASRPRKGTLKLGQLRCPPSGFCSARIFRGPPLRSLCAGALSSPVRAPCRGRRCRREGGILLSLVGFCGSRSLPSPSSALVSRVVGAVLAAPGDLGVAVGCCVGADQAVISSVLAVPDAASQQGAGLLLPATVGVRGARDSLAGTKRPGRRFPGGLAYGRYPRPAREVRAGQDRRTDSQGKTAESPGGQDRGDRGAGRPTDFATTPAGTATSSTKMRRRWYAGSFTS